MSTATTIEHPRYALEDEPLPDIRELPHYQKVGERRFWCVQEDCDGVHHYCVSCER